MQKLKLTTDAENIVGNIFTTTCQYITCTFPTPSPCPSPCFEGGGGRDLTVHGEDEAEEKVEAAPVEEMEFVADDFIVKESEIEGSDGVYVTISLRMDEIADNVCVEGLVGYILDEEDKKKKVFIPWSKIPLEVPTTDDELVGLQANCLVRFPIIDECPEDTPEPTP